MYEIRVIIADSDKAFGHRLRNILRHVGYMPVAEVGNARELLQVAFQEEPDLIILEDKLPGGEGMGITAIIEEHRLAPVVLTISQYQLPEINELAHMPGVYGIIVKPLQDETVPPVLEVALSNFQRFVCLEKEAEELRKSLKARRLVERAKGMLMEKKGLREGDAYKYLQKLSMNTCLPMDVVARKVISKIEG